MLEKYEHQFQELQDKINVMGADIVQAADTCEKALISHDIEAFDTSREALNNLDNNANLIDQDIIRILALFEPEGVELRRIVAYLKVTTELVRIGDHMKSFSKQMKNHIQNETDFAQQHEYAVHLGKSACQAIAFAIESLSVTDVEEATVLFRKCSVEESKTDDLYAILEKSILANLCKNVDNSVDSIRFLSTMRKLERLGDRSVNITKLVRLALIGGEVKHFG